MSGELAPSLRRSPFLPLFFQTIGETHRPARWVFSCTAIHAMNDLTTLKRVFFSEILNLEKYCGIMNLLRGDELALTALMDLSAVEVIIDVNEYDYRKEPFASLLNECLPSLSVQDLNLISGDIQEYVLPPDKDAKKTDLFNRYPSAQLVLSEFRLVFRSMVRDYQKKELIVDGQSIDPQKQKLYVHEIVQRLTYLLYQRLTCYTAGLDIDLITSLSATDYESKSPEGENIAILPSLKWLEKNAVAVFEPLDRVALEQPQLRAIRKQLNVCGNGALAVYKDDSTGIYKTVGLISKEVALKFPRFQFQKHAEWLFAVADSKDKGDGRVRYCNGSLMLPVLDLRDVYQKKANRLPIKDKTREQLSHIINAVNGCKHGAILIIAEKKIIQKEVKRLASNKRGIRLAPRVPLIQNEKPSPVLEQFAAVDGAIFLDFDGNCYAFGVILDGIVNNDGNNARGSRYNSTKAYTEWVRDVKYPGATILGVVKSEDGMMDIFDETKGSKSADKSLKTPLFLKKFQKLLLTF